MTDDDMFQVLRVGGPFSEERAWWPEGVHVWLDASAIRIGIFLNNPHPVEQASIESGVGRFAWTVHGSNAYLLCKYGQLPWNDAPYTPHRTTEPFDMPPLERGHHRSVYTFLVHADTNIIAAMRMFSWPAYFINHIVASVQTLQALPYAEPEARAEQAEFYRQYPDGPSLARLVRTLSPEARCQGGQREDRPH